MITVRCALYFSKISTNDGGLYVRSETNVTKAKQIQNLAKQIRSSNHEVFIIKQDPGNPACRMAWEVVTVH
jgi:hypothetical protein